MYKFLLLFAIVFSGNKSVCAQNGTFWHISDIHVDWKYSNTGNPSHFCHESTENQSDEDIGIYGNFLCDSPEILAAVTIDSMKQIQEKPDFIIWTGDNLPHVRPELEWPTVYEVIKNVTDMLTSSFPGIPIYPCLGNHDSFPPNILLPHTNDSVYVNYLNKGGWDKIITDKEAQETFLVGGFYTTVLMPHLRLISLNTILWYETNKNVTDMEDPAGQFQWLDEVLKNATSAKEKEKVYIIGHVPPGYYNKAKWPVSDQFSGTYHPQFLEKYLQITGKHYSIIAGQFFGHIHLDSFQLFQYDSGVTRGSALWASSVTPWHSLKHKGLSLAVNPSVRLMQYEQNNGSLTNYNQYFLNLTMANKMDPGKKPKYELLYTFTEAYGVPDVSTASLCKVYEKLKSSNTMFDKFYYYMTAGEDSPSCDEHCKTAQLCAMSCSSPKEYFPCMQNSPAADPTTHTTLYAVMGTLIVILVVVSLIAFYRLRHRSGRTPRQYEQFSEF